VGEEDRDGDVREDVDLLLYYVEQIWRLENNATTYLQARTVAPFCCPLCFCGVVRGIAAPLCSGYCTRSRESDVTYLSLGVFMMSMTHGPTAALYRDIRGGIVFHKCRQSVPVTMYRRRSYPSHGAYCVMPHWEELCHNTCRSARANYNTV
jgi:hypothetical protein